MGLFSQVSKLFHGHRPVKQAKSEFGPNKRLIPRINPKSDFQRCDKCGRLFLKTKLKHVEDTNEDLCKDCYGLLKVYRNDPDLLDGITNIP